MVYERQSETHGFNMEGNYVYFDYKKLDRDVGRARSSSPDLARSRDVRSGDLDLALRISKEAKSLSGTRPCFTLDAPKRKIAPWVVIMATSTTWDVSGGRGV